jgi:hypothetical protein
VNTIFFFFFWNDNWYLYVLVIPISSSLIIPKPRVIFSILTCSPIVMNENDLTRGGMDCYIS